MGVDWGLGLRVLDMACVQLSISFSAKYLDLWQRCLLSEKAQHGDMLHMDMDQALGIGDWIGAIVVGGSYCCIAGRTSLSIAITRVIKTCTLICKSVYYLSMKEDKWVLIWTL
jgi:hypothetical protein